MPQIIVQLKSEPEIRAQASNPGQAKCRIRRDAYASLWSEKTGFSKDVAVVSVSYPLAEPPARLAEEISESLERLRRIPGVSAAAASSGPLLDSYVSRAIVRLGGRILPVAPVRSSGNRGAVAPRIRLPEELIVAPSCSMAFSPTR